MSGPPPAILDQPGFDLHADHGDRIIRTMIALIVLGPTFVTLRLFSRHLTRAGFWWDDVLMVLALILAIVPCICNIIAVKYHGFGKHIYVFGQQGGMEATTGFFQTLYPFTIFFTLATGTTKFTILAFYRRIFPIAELMSILLVTSMAAGLYAVTFTLVIIFQCHPIRKFWEVELPGHCINPTNNLIISGAINCFLDLIIVCLPIPLLWRLRTSTRQKSVLTVIFLTAGFVCFVSIIRIVSYTKADPDDVTWNFVSIAIWSAVEPIVGIFGACLPSLRPLLTLLLDNNAFRSFVASTSKTFQTTTSSTVLMSNQSKSKHQDSATFSRLGELDAIPSTQKLPWRDQKEPRVYDNDFGGHIIIVHGGRGQSDRGDGDFIEADRTSDVEPPKGAIRVKTEIFLSTSKKLDYNDRLY